MTECPTPEFIARYRSGRLEILSETRDFDAHLQTCALCRAALWEQTRHAAPGFAAHFASAPNDSLHPDDAQMLAYTRGALDDADKEIVQSHLDQCARCAADVSDLQAFQRQMQDTDFTSTMHTLAHPTLRERLAAMFVAFGQGAGRAAGGLYNWWRARTINGRLVIALLAGILAGLLLRERAGDLQGVGSIFLRVLESLATLFIFVAILHTLLRTEVTGRTARRLIYLALTNTLAAVLIGILVGNVVQPGARWPLTRGAHGAEYLSAVIAQPSNTVLQSLLNNALLFIVLLGVAFGVTLRMTRQEQIRDGKKDYEVVEAFIATTYRSLSLMMNGIVMLFPLAVFAVIAAQVGKLDWHLFTALLGFSATVILALGLQVGFYLTRLWFRAAIAPVEFLRSAKEAIFTAFSTSSSAVTMPITYRNLRDKVGVRQRSAGLGILVGGHFNRDGTALYEAITPIFIAQAAAAAGIITSVGLVTPLNSIQQMLVALMAVIASVAAPGLPNTGLITMVLVFRSVNLPTEYILLLPVVDWFLDRCRTVVNVLGSMTVTCLLDRRTAAHDPRATAAEAEEVLEPEIVY